MFKHNLVFTVIILITFLLFNQTSFAQTGGTVAAQADHEEEYSESALRRFEIVTLSSLPFTAIHSYLGVRGVKMIRTNKIAPELTSENYQIMGIAAVSFSLFIGIWDWFHTRNVDRSAPSVPGRKPPSPPTEDGEESGGSIAQIPHKGSQNNSIYVINSQFHSLQWSMDTQLNQWVHHPSANVSIPLIQIRF